MLNFKGSVISWLGVCVMICFMFMCILNFMPISSGLDDVCALMRRFLKFLFYSDSCEKHHEPKNLIHCNSPLESTQFDALSNQTNFSHKKKLAIIVPFRDRFEELLHFAPHMNRFLSEQKIPHHIFIVNQVDRFRFNRASLINVGFLSTKDRFDYICMHDVDLLPLNNDLKYDFPVNGPFHVAAPGLHPKYNYVSKTSGLLMQAIYFSTSSSQPTFIGGIVLIRKEHFELVNGMSNKYWGWGLEDDEFYVRLKDAGLKVSRPENIKTDTTNTFNHIHDRAHRKRDTAKCFNQKDETRKRDRQTGLDTIKYTISEKRELTIDGVRATILNVQLECDKDQTPWCDCGEQLKNPAKPKVKRGL